MKVLGFGSLNIDYVYQVDDFVHRGETISSKSLQLFPGGKGLNQSIALARAGLDVYHAGAVGKEGTWLLDVLKDSGVKVNHVVELDEIPTGHAIIQNSADGDNGILLLGGANKQIAKEQMEKTLDQFEEGDWMVLQNEINDIPQLMKMAKEKGLKIALTPAPMSEEVKDWPLNLVDLLFVNETEAKALGKILDDFQGEVVMTLGEKGAKARKDGMEYFQDAFPAHAVDTTAAGDCFAGFYLAGRLEDKSIEDCLKQAACAAAYSVEHAGAAVSIPKMETVQKLLG